MKIESPLVLKCYVRFVWKKVYFLLFHKWKSTIFVEISSNRLTWIPGNFSALNLWKIGKIENLWKIFSTSGKKSKLCVMYLNYSPEFDRFTKSWKSFCLFFDIFGKLYGWVEYLLFHFIIFQCVDNSFLVAVTRVSSLRFNFIDFLKRLQRGMFTLDFQIWFSRWNFSRENHRS